MTGGPAFPGTGDAARSPVGELAATHGGGSALIAFYDGPARARLLEHEVVRNAQRFGGRAERRGAATVLWLGAPDSLLRGALRACAFD